MRASFAKGEIDQGDGGLAARHHEGMPRTLHLSDPFSELEGVGGAIYTICVPDGLRAPVIDRFGDCFKDNSGATMYCWNKGPESAWDLWLGLYYSSSPVATRCRAIYYGSSSRILFSETLLRYLGDSR